MTLYAKKRSKTYEIQVARILGGKRHLADTGGKEDVAHSLLSVQVKSGLNVMNGTIREALNAANIAALGTGKLPAAAIVDRSQTRLGYYLVFDMKQWADFHGFGGTEE